MYQNGGLAQSKILDLLTKIDFKDLNCGIGFVNPHSMINQNSLGHSQFWRFKKQKKYNYYD